MRNKYFDVMTKCHTWLKFLNLTNKNGIHLDLYEISNWLFYFMYLLPLNWLFIFCIWFDFDNDFNLTAIIWSTTLSTVAVQMELIFLSLLSQKKLLIELLDRLQILINQSMYSINFFRHFKCLMYMFLNSFSKQ